MNRYDWWRSLALRSIFGKPRARRRICASPWLAAEVLEQRQLLAAANVNLSVAAGAITLTATDGGGHSVDVHRVDPTNVVFDLGVDMQVTFNGVVHTSRFEVAIPTVASVTVNLGTGTDYFTIHNLSTTGDITFNGNPAGGAGGLEFVSSDAANMVIGGSVKFNVGMLNGNTDASQGVFTSNTGNLTVDGSILCSASGSAAADYCAVVTGGASSAGLLVKGAVCIKQSTAGGAAATLRAGNGNLTINGRVSLCQSSSGSIFNDILTDLSGSIAVGQGVTISDSGSGEQQSEISTGGLGEIGDIKIGPLGVTIRESGSGNHHNDILSQSTGSIVIEGSVSVFDDGTGRNEFNLSAAAFVAPLLGGNVTVWGSVYYNNAHNIAGNDLVTITAITDFGSGVVTIRGGLTLLLARDASAGNTVRLGGEADDSSPQITVDGPLLLVSGDGRDHISIDEAVLKSAVTIATGASPTGASSGDRIAIVASEFDGPLSITMTGPRSEVDVNTSSGHPQTVFDGPVILFMGGPDAVIHLSSSGDSGLPVVFNSVVLIVGGFGGFPAGTLFIDGPVHFAISPILLNFIM